MESRREFLRKTLLFSGAAGIASFMPASIQKAFAINPEPGSSFLDAEHIVILMQENRSFDHTLGSLAGVRGFNDPRSVRLPNGLPVWYQTDREGRVFAPFRLNLKESKVTWMGSLPHSRASQVDAFNQGRYDQWLPAKQSGNKQYAAMPLTLGYFTREDLPFHYALADAFTVCDQNFCSGMTSTTPNRSFFWTGKITEMKDGLQKVNIRNDDYSYGKMTWETFPELLEKNSISWRFYQNETSCGGGLTGEERAWLSNFGCNLLEFFQAYQVKFKDTYISNLEAQVRDLPGQIAALEERSPESESQAEKIRADIRKKSEVLGRAEAELKSYNAANYKKLSDFTKSLNQRAFTVNKGDNNYRKLDTLGFGEKGKKRTLEVPKGDVLYQFRKDVDNGTLPAVSWLAGPKNFSDHPSAPWYGAWYVSEVLDILTKNPEVWKKTIFIITYDENDGYYDHVKPFVVPDLKKADTGACSAGIDTEVEMVRLTNELQQGIPKKQAREAAIGLGFRVPMYIVSPWSRGGKVCSQLFDHTSTLQFLESFFSNKYKKDLRLENISSWRRTICGDLTAAFTPFTEKEENLPFLNRNSYIETIYNAQFKGNPAGFVEIDDLNKVKKEVWTAKFNRVQESGIRKSPTLPYAHDAEAYVSNGKFKLMMQVDTAIFGKRTSGVPFNVYSPKTYRDSEGRTERYRNWNFAVSAGDQLLYQWDLSRFEGSDYAFELHGPNGFYRRFTGQKNAPAVSAAISPELKPLTKTPTGKLRLVVRNRESQPVKVEIKSLNYQNYKSIMDIGAGKEIVLSLDIATQGNWYDLLVMGQGSANFAIQLAGRLETGVETTTDPLLA
ncbi:phospholipase C, phosphocholine-specific [Sphingobacterium sp. InxBP1]|uniref:phosphocholine-specific phospholipase C n=1 Tax=Sphingobacterium sp. InxBP1 TaxID=2870328 RepID=UPI0022430307|nr:phospholipase C, phosphocholine-specific [Sphingobacterium sp. InxBP1]MCW8312818.1 phospholipase C, phosphocholine-specific [Sphingobacterium sp. InxBP1]